MADAAVITRTASSSGPLGRRRLADARPRGPVGGSGGHARRASSTRPRLRRHILLFDTLRERTRGASFCRITQRATIVSRRIRRLARSGNGSSTTASASRPSWTSAWALSLTAATWLRYEFDWSEVNVRGVVLVSLVAAAVQIVAGSLMGLYYGRWRFGSFEEVAALGRTTAVVTMVVCWWPSR